MENQQSPTERPNEPGMETNEQTDGCWLTGGQGRFREEEETQEPWGLGVKKSRQQNIRAAQTQWKRFLCKYRKTENKSCLERCDIIEGGFQRWGELALELV